MKCDVKTKQEAEKWRLDKIESEKKVWEEERRKRDGDKGRQKLTFDTKNHLSATCKI